MNINQKIKHLIVNECACYSAFLNDIKDYCDREYEEDCRCSLFKDKRCEYFERAVLPMNPQLEELYKADIKAKTIGYELSQKEKESIIEKESSIKGKIKIHCKKCGKIFLADNYRQQYCKFCKGLIRRENKRVWISNKRNANVGKSAL